MVENDFTAAHFMLKNQSETVGDIFAEEIIAPGLPTVSLQGEKIFKKRTMRNMVNRNFKGTKKKIHLCEDPSNCDCDFEVNSIALRSEHYKTCPCSKTPYVNPYHECTCKAMKNLEHPFKCCDAYKQGACNCEDIEFEKEATNFVARWAHKKSKMLEIIEEFFDFNRNVTTDRFAKIKQAIKRRNDNKRCLRTKKK